MYTDGEGNLLATLTAEYGSETPTIDDPTREGYRFDKWEPALAETVSGDVIYTAQWVKTWTLHFEGYENLDITVDAGETASFAFVSGGLTQKYSLKDTAEEQFLGWDTDADVAHDKVSCAKYTNGQKDTNKGPFSFEMKEDITLYPIFGAMYKLTAMYNDGTENALNTNDAKPGTFARLMIGTRPTRSGYTLLGYSRSKDATEPDADLAKSGNTTTYVYMYLEGDTTIWAVWEAKEYVIGYDLNGGEGTVPEDYVFTMDNKKDIVLPAAGVPGLVVRDEDQRHSVEQGSDGEQPEDLLRAGGDDPGGRTDSGEQDDLRGVEVQGRDGVGRPQRRDEGAERLPEDGELRDELVAAADDDVFLQGHRSAGDRGDGQELHPRLVRGERRDGAPAREQRGGRERQADHDRGHHDHGTV